MGNSASSDLGVRFLSGCPEIPPTPTGSEVQRQFDEVLQWKQVSHELVAELNSMESIETKWLYVFLSKLAQDNGGQQEWLEPHQCVHQIERLHDEMGPISDLFRAIRINILLRESVWSTQFVDRRGVSALVELLQTSKATAPIVPGEILNVLFVLMCRDDGIEALIQEPNLCSSLLKILQSTSLRTLKARILRLLTILCHKSSIGCKTVLRGFDSCKVNDSHRFHVFSSIFENYQDGDVALIVAVTTMLEALTASSMSSSHSGDIHVELKDAGVLSFLERVRSGVLKFSDPDADETLAMKAAAILDMYPETTPANTDKEKETTFAKISVEADTVSYHIDLTDSGASSSPSGRPEKGVSLRAASKFKLHVPGASSNFKANIPIESPPKASGSPQKTSENPVLDASQLTEVLSQLQQHSQQLDQVTSAKLTGLLAQISVALADTKSSSAKSVVDLLDQSLNRHGRSLSAVSPLRDDIKSEETSSSSHSGVPDCEHKRVKFALSAEDLDSSADDEPNDERVASEARTESVDESREPSSGSPVEDSGGFRRRANIKLSLPLFQSFRKGPGLGATPACTPIATASVRKDAKRPVFPPQVSESLFVLEEVSPDPSTRTVARETSSLALPPLPLSSSNTSSINANGAESVATATPAVSGGGLARFRKLLAMGAPRDAVRAKMQQAGVDPDLLDEEPQGFAPSPRANSSASTAVAASSTPDAATPTADISKFRKLLAMGAPVAAVKAKMVQAGVDPNLLDQQAAADHPPPAPSVDPATTNATTGVEKFKKLLAMGAPLAAVKSKMTQAGLDPTLLEVSSVATPLTALETRGKLVRNDPEYAKFFKLLAMGAPSAAVKAKMTQAGLNPALLDTPDAEAPSIEPQAPSGSTPQATEAVQKVKDHPDYVKFFKLLSMGAPAESVKAKIRMAGLNPDLLDTPDADMPGATPASASVKVKEDPNYAKFFKLLSMGAPSESVKAKMRMAGLNAELLDTPDAVMPSSQPEQSSAVTVKVKDDPEYAKFFKLLAMNAPIESVKAKMRMAGLNADLLDTPDANLPCKNAPAAAPGPCRPTAAAATPVARRAHLSLSIPPPVKQTTRPFYWQHLRGDAIKGTIWEEIDRESSNQSNQVPLVLTDSDLAALENEFPPPNKDGPMTGGRQRSGSLDLGPLSPASPLASPRVVFLIDRSRANNISIIVKQFRVSNAALREAIMKVDASVLSLERVQGLMKILPTEEEMAAISAFQGDPMTLNEAERILKELMTVPRLKQRLSSMLAKLQFPGLARDLEERIAKVSNASREIADSAEFKSVLQVVLQVGNKMNNGSNRGNAKGFRLGDLVKLAQLKSVDRSVTLLHYVARMMRHKKGNMVHLSDSLASLYSVQSVPIPELQGDMNKIGEVVETISGELTAQKLKNSIEEQEAGDAFVPVMTAFLETAAVTTASLKESLEKTMELLGKTIKRFDKDPDEDSAAGQVSDTSGIPNPAVIAAAGEFFSTVYEFSVALSKADRDNEVKRVREEKRLKLQQQKSQIPMRSRSSLDVRGRGHSLKTESEVRPETPEKSKEDQAEDSGSTRPGRSASTSAIIGTAATVLSDATTPKSPLAAAKTSVAKMMSVAVKPVKVSSGCNDKSKAVLEKKQPASVATATDTGKPPQHLRASSAAKRDESQQGKDARKDKVSKKSPRTVLTTPGKIIRASKTVSNLSPLKSIVSGTSSNVVSPLKIESLVPSTEKNRMNPRSVEKVVPFDGSSIGEIRSSLESKHGARVSPRADSDSKLRRDRDTYDNNRTLSPEENSSEAEAPSSNLSRQIEA